jgi:uncharacterized membrane protein YbaN (DUF454 family)
MTRPRLLVSKAVRPLLFAAGCLLTVVGIAGLILPLLPGTIFLILAAACFARSSPRFENWLITHPQFGPSIVGWRKTGAIPRHVKVIAISAMALSFVLTWYSGAPPIALWIVAICLAGSALYVGTRPSGPR